MTEGTHIVIVGAGHNGLACAAYLARAGLRVTVLEAREVVGGAAATCEFAPGYRASQCAQFVYQLQPEVVRELELMTHGLSFSEGPLATVALSADGEHLALRGDVLEGSVSERDALRVREFRRLTSRFASFLRRLNNHRPPLLADRERQDNLAFASLGLSLRRLGRDDMREFLRIIAINVYDLLNEYFDSDLLKGALALDAVLGTHLGPRSPNTVFTYLHRAAGGHDGGHGLPWQSVGGMGNVASALASAARQAGVEVRTGARVQRIVVEKGRAAGVELADGERIAAQAVVSNADPRTTVLGLVGARHFETGFARRIRNLRMHGNAARLHLALDGLPAFTGLPESLLGERLVVAPDMDYVERAFNPAKYGEYSPEPVLEIAVPSVADRTLAPPGKHVLSATVQYAPYALEEGWDDSARERCAEVAIDRLAAYAPDLRERIVAYRFLSPQDIEARIGIHGGHWHHGELVLDQFLFVRPVVGGSQYALPLDGLYLCGAGAHPGGGVAGWAGRNAAQAILRKEQST